MTPGRIYILPTRSWVVLAAVLAAMWYAAISQRNSPAYLLMFFLSSLVLVSALHAHFALADLRLRVGRVEPVFEGENVRFGVEAINLSRRPRVALALAPNGFVFKEDAHVRFAPLGAQASVQAEMAFPAGRRGQSCAGPDGPHDGLPAGVLAVVAVRGRGRFAYLVYPLPEGPLRCRTARH